MTRLRGVVCLSLAALATATTGCKSEPAEPPPDPSTGCRHCHGSRANAAPPKALDGSEDPSSPGVGAHQIHLLGGAIGRAVPCTECHLRPEGEDDPGHMDTDLPAEVIFGAFTSSAGATQPAWDHAALTCANTYCHGATLGGGALTTPRWNAVDGTQSACGSCHGLPPPAPHPQRDACEACHAPVAGAGLAILDPRRHVDGEVDLGGPLGEACSRCHGSETNAAPPRDLAGGSDTSRVTVGAHQTHLSGGAVSKPVECAACHLVPIGEDDPGHADTPAPAELTFGVLATKDGAAPTWDRDGATCANTYCHGSSATPTWTRVDGTEARCGTCHALPPPAPHPNSDACERCHAPVVGPGLRILEPHRHVDGNLDVRDVGACSGCHGTTTNAAPPRDLAGGSDTRSVTVGAHQSHLSGGVSSRPVECSACHLVPAALNDPGHVDTSAPAELTFGVLATRGGAAPVWERASATCRTTYCHGLAGAPLWTSTDGTGAACGSCHALPPPAPHPASERCELCHLPTAGPNKTIANRDTHVDGTVQVATDDCTGCHGSAVDLAPPVDSMGRADPALPSVGAHRAHTTGGRGSLAVSCDSCHVVPTSIASPGHVDPSPAEILFARLATHEGSRPTFDAGAARCDNTYCHGATLTGGDHTAPIWTLSRASGNNSEAACGSCHGLPPPAPHPAVARCEICHAPTAGPDQTIANRATHVDGVLQVASENCDSCHGSAVSNAPPRDLSGGTSNSTLGVGAHRSHLEASHVLSRAVACNECHLVPTATDTPGHLDTPLPAELTFGPLATANGASPVFDRGRATCADTYCHGGTLPDRTNPSVITPVWTAVDGSAADCGSCHGMPPRGGHPNDDRCDLCHLPTAGPNHTIADRTTHIDGVVQAPEGCDTCHGGAGVSSPPHDLDGRTETERTGVGAHAAHASGGRGGRAVACTECHVVPLELDSPGHRDDARPAEVTFGLIASFGARPSWTANGTCANTYCHAASGATAPDPRWTLVDGSQAQCDSCHGMPPPAPHPTADRCELCHAPTAAPNQQIADRNTHVDGVLQVAAEGCFTCHGSMESSAPPNDLMGRSDTALLSVGAHRSHLEAASGISRPVACAECHLVPDAIDSPGHVDTPAPAEVRFGALSSSNGARPLFDRMLGTCADSYCHGGTLPDGPVAPPVWTRVDGSESACGSCHGMPPRGGHPTDDRCERCHLPTAGPGHTIADPTTHIDGVVQAASGCDSCHGGGGVSAPPVDLAGLSGTDRISVGAHRTHLDGGLVSRPVGCAECHLVPARIDSAGHRDTPGPAEVTFGLIASFGATPIWNAGSCADTYCHSGAGAATPNPTWTIVDGTQASCGGCHGNPPPTPEHQGARECTGCHLPTAGPGATIANRATHGDGILQVTSGGCTSCHGDASSPAPPMDLDGQTAATDREVGAHRVHLSGGVSSAPVACDGCHLVPAEVGSPGHNDTMRPAELQFGGVASAGGATPTFNATARNCSNTYCHGASAPVWSAPGTAACGSCHALPPPAPHPANPACEMCHAPVAGPNRTIADRSRHVDGVLDTIQVTCDGCHGSAANFAPPSDLAGLSDTGRITVGAHQTHLTGGVASKPVDCAACHRVPAALNAPGHVDTPAPAEVTFSALAVADGARPTWERAQATCRTTYCHGGTLIGGPAAPPAWTVVDGTGAACGTCHALPPPAPHPESDRCDLCHLPTAGPNLQIANRATHVDGVVQVAAEQCTGCHGDATSLAPPPDSFGRTDPALPSVGAHQAHLAGGRSSLAVACDTCHTVPASVSAPGHVDAAPAEVRFFGLAVQGGLRPTWTTPANRCSSTYCHGGALAGGSRTAPVWTGGPTEASCGSCHGLPPPAPHPATDRCELCHAPTAGPNRQIANRATHVDGTLQLTEGGCETCHGSIDNAAPPVDLAGRSETTRTTVGAHQSHLLASSGISRPVACNECHVVPAALDSPGHVDTPSPAEVSFGPLASSHGALPSFDPGLGTCSNTWCHGGKLRDGSLTAPVWTSVDGTQAACGSCHGVPPAGGHPTDDRCERCHLPTAGPGMTIADPSTHIDGVLQASEGCDSCHGSGGVSAPPLDLSGSNDTRRTSVGAHRTHVLGGLFSRPVACNECHVVPAALDSAGHRDTPAPAEVTFGPIASFGSRPSWSAGSCADTYCHSGVGATNPNPSWTIVDGTQADCGSCHAVPPATPVHQGARECNGCHLPTAGPGQTIADRSTHGDGIVQVTGGGCASCHGDQASPAPPSDLDGHTASTDLEVGAHRAHLWGGVSSAPVACDSCHLVPRDVGSPGHNDTPRPAELTFSGRAAAGGSSPSYDRMTHSCAGTYCHGGASSGGTNVDPTWNQPGTADCGSCHGLPPAAPHPQVDACELCHAPVAGANHTIADRTRHVDGVTQVSAFPECRSCHGSAANAAPPADLAGQQSSPVVGSHQAHVAGTGRSRPVACSECHVPVADRQSANQAGHWDSARPAEVIFGALARTGGLSPARTGDTCTNTYCHGATLPGAANPRPSFSGGALACNSCHGAPPPDSNHAGNATACERCHPDTAGPNQTIINPLRHVDGVVDTSATCDACHGSNGDPTPPRDLAGLTVSDEVGAHAAHKAPSHSAPVACATCHLVPATFGAPGHTDTPAPAEVRLAGVAAADGASPSYSALGCAGSYCHGATLPGGAASVLWNDADGSESACGACHGMPPQSPAHSGVVGPNGCNACHADVAGPNQQIVAPALHVDGVVEVSGGGCDTCHGSPPAPGRESYPGSAGAHARHTGALGMECATCHGNNGSGPQHNEGANTVTRGNVDVVFASGVRYPGGTTMNNGSTASYDRNARTCAVGCHNPIVGNPAETPNLTVRIAWTAAAPACRGCHDAVSASMPNSHDIAALGNAGCLECHDQSRHLTGALAIRDPDPADAFSWAPANGDGLCKTCHDGGTGRYFGGKTPRNVSPYWTVSSHGAEAIRCSRCHTVHSSAGGPLFFDRRSTSCMAAGCHADLSAAFGQVPGGPISHHRIEGGPGISINCNDCHNPHLSQAPPLSTIDPDNKWTIYSLPAAATTQRVSSGDYRPFCLRCHDATPPPGVTGAMNIAQILAGGADPTHFKEGTQSLHDDHHDRYNCMNCHMPHGSPGTPGINRGRLLRGYMTINQYSQTANYNGEASCSTPRPVPGFGFGCH